MKSSLVIRGVHYAFDDFGSGPLILFGHGMLFDRGMFRSQAEALSDHHRCVLLDWPGHGDSGFRAGGWVVDDLVADVVDLIRNLGERKATLVGLSQGAAVFTRVAIEHPELVRALVILDATPSGPPQAARDWLAAASQAVGSGDSVRRQAALDQALERMFSPNTWRHHASLVDEARALFASHDPVALALAMRVPFSYGSIVERLGNLELPTLICWGEDDAGSPIELARHYLDAIAGAKFVSFASAGHSLPLEQPHAVTEALQSFIGSLGKD